MNVAEWYASRSHMEVNPGSIPNSLGIFQKNILRGKTWNHEKANKASRWPATLTHLLKFTDAIFDVVEHYTKTTRESWDLIMETDTAVLSQIEDVVNEIRWKLSVNAVKLFKVSLFESS